MLLLCSLCVVFFPGLYAPPQFHMCESFHCLFFQLPPHFLGCFSCCIRNVHTLRELLCVAEKRKAFFFYSIHKSTQKLRSNKKITNTRSAFTKEPFSFLSYVSQCSLFTCFGGEKAKKLPSIEWLLCFKPEETIEKIKFDIVWWKNSELLLQFRYTNNCVIIITRFFFSTRAENKGDNQKNANFDTSTTQDIIRLCEINNSWIMQISKKKLR